MNLHYRFATVTLLSSLIASPCLAVVSTSEIVNSNAKMTAHPISNYRAKEVVAAAPLPLPAQPVERGETEHYITLPPPGEIRELAHKATIDSQGIVRDDAGTKIARINADGQIQGASSVEITDTDKAKVLGLFGIKVPTVIDTSMPSKVIEEAIKKSAEPEIESLKGKIDEKLISEASENLDSTTFLPTGLKPVTTHCAELPMSTEDNNEDLTGKIPTGLGSNGGTTSHASTPVLQSGSTSNGKQRELATESAWDTMNEAERMRYSGPDKHLYSDSLVHDSLATLQEPSKH